MKKLVLVLLVIIGIAAASCHKKEASKKAVYDNGFQGGSGPAGATGGTGGVYVIKPLRIGIIKTIAVCYVVGNPDDPELKMDTMDVFTGKVSLEGKVGKGQRLQKIAYVDVDTNKDGNKVMAVQYCGQKVGDMIDLSSGNPVMKSISFKLN